MDQTVLSIIYSVVALVIGIIAGRVIFAKNTKKQVEEAEKHAQSILKEAELRAETIKKEKLHLMPAFRDKDRLERDIGRINAGRPAIDRSVPSRMIRISINQPGPWFLFNVRCHQDLIG